MRIVGLFGVMHSQLAQMSFTALSGNCFDVPQWNESETDFFATTEM